ncbi:DUF305 domain-containing protein [Amycolatopsis rhizosphaerae]|uniref:DUF305 domain-containing protein n=1 Tax=Amycolatopsis rhizosphaerae TaxID=2053003 RepID=A0A558CMS5_9PSEU|nr:DUF305 domain-containing protein [Amycolatopsis rhizosphaerae]TVT50070.1 DUF305 domain-containing protein [Amycolatopsis rhizosphaerae]
MSEVENEQTPDRPVSRSSRPFVIVASALSVLLLGAAFGMFLTQRAMDSSAQATPAAGSVEVGFAQDMSVHHLQAVTMANWARDHSADPEIRQLAFDIQSTQLEQVGRMKGWLMLWGQPEQSNSPYMSWMTGSSGHEMAGMPGMAAASSTAAAGSGDAAMPGMATNAELAKLRSLSGKDLDVYFLQLMLRHHQGGTPMAEYAHEHTSLSALKALTKSILDSQGAEMDLMKQMLTARGAQPLP